MKKISSYIKNLLMWLWQFPQNMLALCIEGIKKNRKVVLQYSLDGKFLARYNHAGEAAEILGCDSSGINRACKENNNINIANTKYKGKYKGFRWYYV